MTKNTTPLLDLLAQSSLAPGLVVLDQRATIVEINPVAEHLLSPTNSPLGQSFIDLLTDGDSQPDDRVADFLNHALKKLDQPLTKDDLTFKRHYQQAEQWLRIRLTTLQHNKSHYLGLILQDVSKTHLADIQKSQQLAEIADQNRQWQAMFNGVQESIVMLDQEGNVVTANPATERITGRKRSEVIGRHVGQLFPKVDTNAPGLDKQGRSGFDQVKQDKRPSDLFEAVVETKDHRHIWVNYTYTPLVDPKGELIGFIRVTSDVSTVKVVDQMKNDFISIASHELRTPLGVINSYLNLFLNGQLGHLTEDQRLFMQRIYHSSGDMSALVEDLLNMSRIEDGHIEIAIQPFAIVDLVSEVLSHLEPRYQTKHIEVNIKDHSQRAIVYADRQKIEQSLTNLIDNAIKYTYDNGTITIDIALADRAVTISISDSGVGIRPENLNHIFEKFYREGNPLSIKEGGSGLGLYISRKLIELHHGTITASSTHNQGSTFTVRLPLMPANYSPDPDKPQQQKGH